MDGETEGNREDAAEGVDPKENGDGEDEEEGFEKGKIEEEEEEEIPEKRGDEEAEAEGNEGNKEVDDDDEEEGGAELVGRLKPDIVARSSPSASLAFEMRVFGGFTPFVSFPFLYYFYFNFF